MKWGDMRKNAAFKTTGNAMSSAYGLDSFRLLRKIAKSDH